MSKVDDLEPFIELLTRNQSRLYAFVYSLVGDAELAQDVFQETNMVLWRKADEFDSSREFMPWAFAIARNQIRAARQKRGRDRLLFDDEAMDRIAERLSQRSSRMDERQVALASCIQMLPEEQRDLVTMRYQDGCSLDRIAQQLDRTANSVAVAIHRLRQSLARCIESKLTQSAKA